MDAAEYADSLATGEAMISAKRVKQKVMANMCGSMAHKSCQSRKIISKLASSAGESVGRKVGLIL